MEKHDRSWLVFDHQKIEIYWEGESLVDDPWERAKSMKELYSDAREEIPKNAPEP